MQYLSDLCPYRWFLSCLHGRRRRKYYVGCHRDGAREVNGRGDDGLYCWSSCWWILVAVGRRCGWSSLCMVGHPLGWRSLCLIIIVAGLRCVWTSLWLVIVMVDHRCGWPSLCLNVAVVGHRCVWSPLWLVVMVVGRGSGLGWVGVIVGGSVKVTSSSWWECW